MAVTLKNLTEAHSVCISIIIILHITQNLLTGHHFNKDIICLQGHKWMKIVFCSEDTI